MHPKFDQTGVQSHDLQIMTVHFMSVRRLLLDLVLTAQSTRPCTFRMNYVINHTKALRLITQERKHLVTFILHGNFILFIAIIKVISLYRA